MAWAAWSASRSSPSRRRRSAGWYPSRRHRPCYKTLNGVLPLPQFVAGASRFLLGGDGDVVGPCLTLVGWSVVALLVSVLFTARRRPELAVAARPQTAPGSLSLAAEHA